MEGGSVSSREVPDLLGGIHDGEVDPLSGHHPGPRMADVVPGHPDRSGVEDGCSDEFGQEQVDAVLNCDLYRFSRAGSWVENDETVCRRTENAAQ